MFKCPRITKEWLREIKFIGPKANFWQVWRAKRNAARVCKLGLNPKTFIVDNRKFGKPYPIKGKYFPSTYTEGKHQPYIVGGGVMTDLGDPGFNGIVGRAYMDRKWWFFYANGDKRPFTDQETSKFEELRELKTFWSNKYIDPRTGQVASSRYLYQYTDPILVEEILTGEILNG